MPNLSIPLRMILIQKCDHRSIESKASAQMEPDFEFKMADA